MTVDTTLAAALVLKISDGAAVLTTDPNGAAAMAFRCDFTPLGEPAAGKSVLSQQPAYRYTASDLDVLLTPEELLRLLRRELSPVEVKALRALHPGCDVFDLHGDFYDLQGVAQQSMSDACPDPRWERAYDSAAAMLELNEALEPTSAFKQAGTDCGIGYGLGMGVFVAWAQRQWVGW